MVEKENNDLERGDVGKQSTHPVMNYFPRTTYPDMFYFLFKVTKQNARRLFKTTLSKPWHKYHTIDLVKPP